jgi:quercetin dioxygenase-like cupin family protein
MVYVTNVEEVEQEELEKGEARLTKVKYLIDERHGAGRFFMRVYDVMPGGRTPLDRHPYEHEVYVLRGTATLVTEEEGRRLRLKLKEGDVVFIGQNQVHQFLNEGSETFRMVCVRGAVVHKEEQRAEEGSC